MPQRGVKEKKKKQGSPRRVSSVRPPRTDTTRIARKQAQTNGEDSTTE